MSDGKDRQPSSPTELKPLVEDFVNRLHTIDNEIDVLKEDRKELIEEFKEKLDVRTLAAALRIHKIRLKTMDKQSLECFEDILSEV